MGKLGFCSKRKKKDGKQRESNMKWNFFKKKIEKKGENLSGFLFRRNKGAKKGRVKLVMD